jgi:hypothetical protein
MPVSAAIITRRRLARKGIGMPGDNDRILSVERSLRAKVDAPVLGGIAVYLHGYPRATTDLDLYTAERRLAARQLEAAGAKWDAERREHVLDRVPIHTVTPDDARHMVEKTSVIDGVRVVSLKDLVVIKLLCWLDNLGRSKHVADVVELIRRVPLDKRFAAKLPTDLRPTFKERVDAVRADESKRGNGPRF